MNDRPSANGSFGPDVGTGRDGRDQRGRFTPGNTGGPGNPHAAQVAKLRAALLEAVTNDDVHARIHRRIVGCRPRRAHGS